MSKISSDYTARDEIADQYRTQQERRAQVREENEAEIESLKKNYESQKANLQDRFEKSIQDDRIRHYENIRNTKTQLNREQMRLESEGRQAIQQKAATIGSTEVKTQQEGEARVNEVKQRYAAAENYERQRLLSAQDQIRRDHRKSADYILKDSEQKIQTLAEDKSQQLKQHQTTHATALQQMQGHYDGLRENTQNQYQSSLKNLYAQTQDDFTRRQMGLMQQIQTYEERARDPFYRMARYESDMLDVGDAYVLRVKVPSYERNQFRIQVSGQEVQVTGVRTNQEKAEIEPGRWVSTNSNQVVQERYPLDTPVDGRAMTLREEGEWLEYHLPKFNQHHRYADAHAPKRIHDQDLALVKEIEFPKSLPRPKNTKTGNGPIGGSNV